MGRIPALLSLVLALGCAGLNRHRAPESEDILARAELAPSAEVKHILLAWKWLDSPYRKMGLTLDPRAQERSETAAEQLAQELLGRLRAGEQIDPLMAQYSEDEASAKSGISMTVEPASPFVEDFKELALRLKPGESGIVKSQFGYHVMQRLR